MNKVLETESEGRLHKEGGNTVLIGLRNYLRLLSLPKSVSSSYHWSGYVHTYCHFLSQLLLLAFVNFCGDPLLSRSTSTFSSCDHRSVPVSVTVGVVTVGSSSKPVIGSRLRRRTLDLHPYTCLRTDVPRRVFLPFTHWSRLVRPRWSRPRPHFCTVQTLTWLSVLPWRHPVPHPLLCKFL